MQFLFTPWGQREGGYPVPASPLRSKSPGNHFLALGLVEEGFSLGDKVDRKSVV